MLPKNLAKVESPTSDGAITFRLGAQNQHKNAIKYFSSRADDSSTSSNPVLLYLRAGLAAQRPITNGA
jgi:hypothetical protein